MSPVEHYFENILFHYVKTDGKESTYRYDDTNTRYFSPEVKQAIQECAVYIIDCCNWNPAVIKDFLDGNYTTPSSK